MKYTKRHARSSASVVEPLSLDAAPADSGKRVRAKTNATTLNERQYQYPIAAGVFAALLAFFLSTPEFPAYRLYPSIALGVCVSITVLLRNSGHLRHLPICVVTWLTWIYFCAPMLYSEIPCTDPRRTIPLNRVFELAFFPAASVCAVALGYYAFCFPVRPFFEPGKRLSSSTAHRASIFLCISGTTYLLVYMTIADYLAPFGRIIGILDGLVLFGFLIALLCFLRRDLTIWVAVSAALAFLAQASAIIAVTLFAQLAYYLACCGIAWFCARRRIPWGFIVVFVALAVPIFINRGYHRFEGNTEFTGVQRTLGQKVMDGLETAAYDYSSWSWSRSVDEIEETLKTRLENLSFLGQCVNIHDSGKPFKAGETIKGVFVSFIPRILYPSKPQQDHGTVLSAEYDFKDEGMHVSINFPWLAELFINFGFWGMVVGSFLMGAVFRGACSLAAYGNGDLNMLMFCDLMWWLFSNENNISMVIGGIIQSLIIWYVISFAINMGRSSQLPSQSGANLRNEIPADSDREITTGGSEVS